ncbi:MAG: sensor domain-containing diguanylate cyclase [Pseudomonadales bacterium]
MISLVSLILVVGFLATSLVSYFVSRNSLKNEIITRELPLVGDNIYSEIQRDLLKPVFVSSVMASDTFLRGWVIDGEKNAAEIQRYLRTIKERYSAFTSFFVSEKTGNYYHTEGVLKKIQPNEERDRWYYRLRETLQNYETNVDPDLANGDAITVFINYKVFDFNGDFIGATGIGLKVSSVRSVIENYKQRYNRTVYFTDKEGRITLWGDNFDTSQLDLHMRAGVSKVAESILGADSGTHEYKLAGETYLLGSRFVPELGWYLIVEQSGSAIFEKLNRALYTNLAICLVIIFIVLVLNNYTINFFQRRLEMMALSDKLTGTDNRHAFSLHFTQVMRDMKRNTRPACLIILDVDHFKAVNDQHGHSVGDHILCGIANVGQRQMREADMFCRWGGEEFLMLLADCSEIDGLRVAEKIRKTLAAEEFSVDSSNISVTASLGVTQIQAGESEDDAVKRVDKALYRAKALGRNRTEVESLVTEALEKTA